jgi:hypothetical protein
MKLKLIGNYTIADDGGNTVASMYYRDSVAARTAAEGTARRIVTRYNAGDAQTIAYVAMGAHAAILALRGGVLPNDVCDAYSGQMHFINAVIEYAAAMDDEADKRDNNLAVVFAYEIAEEFGYRYANALIHGTDERAADIIAELFADNDKVVQA